VAAVLLLAPPRAEALPSYARQTGQQCAACHNGFPELTPYGRLFKLNGYTFGGGQSDLPPIAAMVVAGYTHTEAGQSGGAAPHFGPNNNPDIETGSLFYGGAIASSLGLGAFAQVTYDNVHSDLHWDNTDLRWARATSVLGSETLFGVSLNNNPGVSDVWNSTPAWGYPYLLPELGPGVPVATVIEGHFAQQVAGLTAYTYWNRLIYAEIGGYRTLSPRTESALGIVPPGDAIKGIAPYWRLAVEPKWGRNTFEVGTFGLAASVIPGDVTGFGTDHATDVGFDVQYQFLAERDSISVQASYIMENQNLTASQGQGIATDTHNHLRSLHVKTSYYYDQTYGGTVGFFHIAGSGDPGLYGGLPSLNNSPNTTGWIGEVDYMPFNHGGPSFWPWLNVKLGVQYIYYDKFAGGVNNFDGAGRNAHDNNTLFFFAWMAF